MPVLETARLRLRDFCEDDLDAFAELWTREGFTRFSGGGTQSRVEVAAMLERILVRTRAGAPALLAVELRDAGRLLGYCGFLLQTVDEQEEIEIAHRLDPQVWGQGIATEAAGAVRDHAFGTLGLRHVISLIHPENIASRRVVEKIGMQFRKETVLRGFPAQIFELKHPAPL